MKIYQDKSLSDQIFDLEECVFINCTLKDCDVFYSGGDFEFSELKLDNTRMHFRGPAKSTIQLAQILKMVREPSQIPSQVTMTSQKPN